MKYRTTEKQQRDNNNIIISFGYCEIQNITKFFNANAYTCGLYGWNADYYNFLGFTVSTGYRPIYFIYNKNKKTQEKYNELKKALLKLDSDIKAGKYKTLKTGDFYKGQAFLNKKINKIYQDIFNK